MVALISLVICKSYDIYSVLAPHFPKKCFYRNLAVCSVKLTDTINLRGVPPCSYHGELCWLRLSFLSTFLIHGLGVSYCCLLSDNQSVNHSTNYKVYSKDNVSKPYYHQTVIVHFIAKGSEDLHIPCRILAFFLHLLLKWSPLWREMTVFFKESCYGINLSQEMVQKTQVSTWYF